MNTSPSVTQNLLDIWLQLKENKSGLVGFVISLLQIVVHGAWVWLISYLAATGKAETLTGDEWQSWTIVILVGTGSLLTCSGLVLCLHGTIKGHPKILAILGLALSFFIAVFLSLVVFMSAGRAAG